MKPVAMPFSQIGIWRSSSGVREAGCSISSASRTPAPARSILLRKRMRGTPSSSSSRRITCSAGVLRGSASHTTIAASQTGSAKRMSWMNSTEPGQSKKVKRSPM